MFHFLLKCHRFECVCISGVLCRKHSIQLYSPAREDEETVWVGMRSTGVLFFAIMIVMIRPGHRANEQTKILTLCIATGAIISLNFYITFLFISALQNTL